MAREKELGKEKYPLFWKRASQFMQSMHENFANKRNMPCVSDAVLCAIASVDSLAIYKIGKTSSSQSHFEAAAILKDIKTSDDAERNRVTSMLAGLLKMKSVAQYEDREPSGADTERAVRACVKIYGFVKSELQKEGAAI